MTKSALTLIVPALLMTAVAVAADANAGKAVYEKACRSCHGADGTPNAAIAKAMKVEMRALGSKEVQALSDPELKKTITDGIGKMKPVKTAVSNADDVVAFVRTLKK